VTATYLAFPRRYIASRITAREVFVGSVKLHCVAATAAGAQVTLEHAAPDFNAQWTGTCSFLGVTDPAAAAAAAGYFTGKGQFDARQLRRALAKESAGGFGVKHPVQRAGSQ
jgi:hypothetical protein